MGFCSSNHFPIPANSHLLNSSKIAPAPAPALRLFYRVHTRSTLQQKGRAKFLAFFGFTAPPYKLDALEPYMSKRTLELHWGEHHRNYLEALNKQLDNNNPLYGCTMDELVKVTYNNGNPLPEFNNAAQIWDDVYLKLMSNEYTLAGTPDRDGFISIWGISVNVKAVQMTFCHWHKPPSVWAALNSDGTITDGQGGWAVVMRDDNGLPESAAHGSSPYISNNHIELQAIDSVENLHHHEFIKNVNLRGPPLVPPFLECIAFKSPAP